MSNKIQVRRGNLADLPTLDPGEFGLTLDSRQLYIGGTTSNVQVLTEARPVTALTINNITVDPTFTYYGGDATPTQITAPIGETLTGVGLGIGTLYNQPCPFLALNYASYFPNNYKTYIASDTGYVNLDNDDFVIELVIKTASGVDPGPRSFIIAKGLSGAYFTFARDSNNQKHYLQIVDASANSSTASTAILSPDTWYHIMCFVDRTTDERAYIYVNGVVNGSWLNLSSHGSLTNASSAFSLSAYTGHIAYAALWQRSGWMDTAQQADVAEAQYNALNDTRFAYESVIVDSGGAVKWESRTQMQCPADGELILSNDTFNDFTNLIFGGNSAAYPAIRRSGTELEIRLADNSAYTGLTLQDLTVNGNLSITGGSFPTITLGSSDYLGWDSKSRIYSDIDGNIRITDSGATDFDLLQFGGTSEFFPALKRNSTSLEVKLADDSAYTAIRSSDSTLSSTGTLEWDSRSKITSSLDGNIVLTDNAGTAFNFLQFGGTSNQFPAIKRNSNQILFRLADNSDYAHIYTAGIEAFNQITLSHSLASNRRIRMGNNVNVRCSDTVDCIVLDSNEIDATFDRLQLGGQTASFPALKRSSAEIEVVLADGSDYTNIRADTVKGTNISSVEDNGQEIKMSTSTTELVGLNGASVTASSLIPAGAIVVGVTTRVNTTITGATSYDVGDGSDVDAFGAAQSLSVAATSDNTDWTISNAPLYTSVTDIVLTANGSSFTGGDVRVTVHYILAIAPNS